MAPTRLKLYDRFSFWTRRFELTDRVPAPEWERSKGHALEYLRETRYSPNAENFLSEGGFDLWNATAPRTVFAGSVLESESFRLLYRTVKIPMFASLEKQSRDPKFEFAASALERIGESIRYILADLDLSETVRSVSVPALRITSETVDRALSDAESLIRANGAPSGLDRVHTAFHGYLRAVCEEAHINFAADSGITHLFQLIRESHPKLRLTDPEAEKRMNDIHRGMARIIDALNPLRNQSSMAHPNQVILNEPEAMLAINSVRTLLHYLNERLAS